MILQVPIYFHPFRGAPFHPTNIYIYIIYIYITGRSPPCYGARSSKYLAFFGRKTRHFEKVNLVGFLPFCYLCLFATYSSRDQPTGRTNNTSKKSAGSYLEDRAPMTNGYVDNLPMVICKSCKDRVVLLLNGLFMAYKWGAHPNHVS